MSLDASKIDFGDLFTDSVRHVVALARAKGVVCMLDYNGPLVRVDAHAQPLRAALLPLCRAGIDVLQQGFAFFTVDVDCPVPGECQVTIDVGCTGVAAPHQTITAVLADLQLHEKDGEPGRSRAALGASATLGGTLSFVDIPNEGSLFTLRLALPGAVPEDEAIADANGARAWLISETPLTYRSLERRLQRVGWTTQVFSSIEAASVRLDELPAPCAGPALVVAYESSSLSGCELSRLCSRLPDGTQVVLATEWGAASMDAAAQQPGVEVRAWPFSPSEVLLFTHRLEPDAPASTGETRPAPLTFASRKRALVVDDNQVNQIVATGLLQLLGLEVDVACDGIDAIERCIRQPPDFVLMDVQMPRMDGVEATKRLRLLQAQGALPRFAIVAATAGGTRLSERDCLDAGMDGHLLKPLTVDALGAALRRALHAPRANATPAIAPGNRP